MHAFHNDNGELVLFHYNIQRKESSCNLFNLFEHREGNGVVPYICRKLNQVALEKPG